MDDDSDDAKTVTALRDAITSSRLPVFNRHIPPLTPRPFPLSKKQVAELEKLGHRLFLFHQALARIHRRSASGKLPAWIADTLNGGAPVLEIPDVFCLYLLLTDSGWSIHGYSNPDEVLPLTAWLTETFTGLVADSLVPFAGPVPPPGTNRPPSATAFALLHLRSLRDVWRQELRGSQFERLEKSIPYAWLMDPAPLPPQAVIPGLEITSMRAVADFSADERSGLILTSPDGVNTPGSNTDTAWRNAVNQALDAAGERPHILQEGVNTATVEHPVWDPEPGTIETRAVAVGLHAVYRTESKTASLAGLLAKLDNNVLAPCAVT